MTALLMCDACGEAIEPNEDARIELRDRGNWNADGGPLHFHDTDECFGEARERFEALRGRTPQARDTTPSPSPGDQMAAQQGVELIGMRWIDDHLWPAARSEIHARCLHPVAPKVQRGPRLEALGLSARLLRALHSAGFLTVEAVEQTPDDSLLRCRDIGRGSVETLRDAVVAFRESGGSNAERGDDYQRDASTAEAWAIIADAAELALAVPSLPQTQIASLRRVYCAAARLAPSRHGEGRLRALQAALLEQAT